MRFVVPAEEAGVRLDKFLVGRIPGLGRAGVKRLFMQGRVRVVLPHEAPPDDGGGFAVPRLRRAAKGDVGTAGLEVDVDVDPTSAAALPDPDTPLHVVLETDKLLVLEKPAGQPTAPLEPGEKGALANALVARYSEVLSCGFSPREPGLCHRLDTDTSGLILAAKSEEAFEVLTTALREGRLDKRYLLLCSAESLPESGSIDIPLAPHPKDRRRVLACVHPRDVARNDPRPAHTEYTKLREHAGIALVEVKAPRARRHQIRAHFAAIDHPLLGDVLYGGDTSSGLTRHALHAHRIAWGGDAHVPAFVVTSPLPADLASRMPE